MNHFRNELFFPEISDRRPREIWLQDGGVDTNDRAWNIAQNIMKEKQPKHLDKSVLRQIKSEFPEIVDTLLSEFI